MKKESVRGEILRGHFSEYKTFIYPPQALTQNQIDLCLQDTLPGPFDSGNQIWRCENFSGQPLLVSAYGAYQKKNKVGGDYCNALYLELTVEALHRCIEKTIHFAFASEEDFLAVAEGTTAFQEGWKCTGAVAEQKPYLLELSPERLAELACCCLYCGLVKKLGYLVILVPDSVDYLACCRSVMVRILSCIPVAMRRYLSFATNASDMEKKRFAVLFAPQGTVVSSKQLAVPLYDTAAWPENVTKTSLPQELPDLIERAAAVPSILEDVYNSVEKDHELDSLSAKSYNGFWLQYVLKLAPPDYKSLQKCSAWLSRPDVPQRDKAEIVSNLNARISDKDLEQILDTDPNLRNAKTPRDLVDVLEKYKPLLDQCDKKLSLPFSSKILKRCVQQWAMIHISPEELIEYKNDMEKCSTLNLLDPYTVKGKCDEIERGLNSAIRTRETKFRNILSRTDDIWTADRLKPELESLSLCGSEVREKCLVELSQSAVERLTRKQVADSEIPAFYEMVSALLENETQRKPLRDWYEKWKTQQENEKKVLATMSGFRAYFMLGASRDQYTEQLWERFEVDGRKTAGIIDFIRAAERVYHRSWPEMIENLSAPLHAFVENHRMGVWLEPGKPWDALYSELLAYKKLASNGRQHNKVFMWYEDVREPERVDLEELLETIDFFGSVLADETDEDTPVDGQYSSKAFQCLLSAGMFNADAVPKLDSYLRAADWNQVHNKVESEPVDTRRHKGGKRQQKNPSKVLRTLIFVAIVALVLALIVILLALIFVGEKKSNNSFPTEEDPLSVQNFDAGLDNIPPPLADNNND